MIESVSGVSFVMDGAIFIRLSWLITLNMCGHDIVVIVVPLHDVKLPIRVAVVLSGQAVLIFRNLESNWSKNFRQSDTSEHSFVYVINIFCSPIGLIWVLNCLIRLLLYK